ncbi:MAG: pyridoxamine 5'-phosphate oxidase family protein [Herpetosiphonaceae bacterium]|nr:pyridoxamine 5'-phosphate oxidase family protein [Herpetosiphonaceae bacterium]
MSHAAHTDDIKTLGEKIKDIRIAMLTTQSDDGTLRSRPMATQEMEFDGDLWFFTYASTPKVEEVKQDQHINLSYAKPDDNLYVSVSGTANLVRDPQKMKELWKPILKTWFPKGLEDPDLALLKVSVTKAEYWETNAGTVQILAGFVKAAVTGKQADIGENKKLDLQHGA